MMSAITFSREAGITSLALLFAGLLGVLTTAHGLAAVAVPFVLVAGAALFFFPVLGLYLFAATIPLESALMFGEVTAARLIGITVFGVWAAQKLLRREPFAPLVSPGAVRIALLLFAVICLSLIWSTYPEAAERRLLTLFQLVLLTVLVLDLTSSWERVAWVAKFLVVAGTVAALLSLEQYFLGGVTRAGGGVTGGLNRTAITLVTILPFAFFLLRSREPMLWRLLGVSYIGLSAIAVSATFSRMNYLMFPLVVMLHLTLMARTRGGRSRVLLLGVAGLVVLPFLPMDALRERAATIAPYLEHTVDADQPTEMYSSRGFLLRAGIKMFQDQPILGVGWQNFGLRFHEEYQWRVPNPRPDRVWGTRHVPHGSHVTFLAQLGLMGFVLWAGLFATVGRSLWTAWRKVRGSLASPQTFVTQTVAIAVGLQFVYGFYDEVHEAKILWLLLGLSVALQRLTSDGITEKHLTVREARGDTL